MFSKPRLTKATLIAVVPDLTGIILHGTTQSEMYVCRSADYIRKSLFIFGYLWNAIRTLLFSVGYSRASLTMYDNI